jgi:riboflavin synthase
MTRLRVRLGKATQRVTVDRGSLAIDGVSLTVAGLSGDVAEFAIIPYTWSRTTLRHLEPAARVNVEADLIGKYVHRLVQPYRESQRAPDTPDDHPDSRIDTDRTTHE